MSKNKDFEKKLEKEQIEKIKPEKELKIEIKEKPEKRELKEYKELKLEKFEKNEKIEIKERIKDFKDREKNLEKPGKEIVEGGGFDPGTVFRAEKPEEGAAAAPKPEELKQKELEKIKPEKNFRTSFTRRSKRLNPRRSSRNSRKKSRRSSLKKNSPKSSNSNPNLKNPAQRPSWIPVPDCSKEPAAPRTVSANSKMHWSGSRTSLASICVRISPQAR